MNKEKLTKILKKEDGAGLVLSLMVLMVLTVLGLAVAGVTIGSYKLGDISRDSNSAYYIAEAGANLAYGQIRDGIMGKYEASNNNETHFFANIADLLAEYDSKEYAEDTFELQFGDQPRATVTVSGPKDSDGGKRYTIESIGEIDGKTRTVEKSFLVKFVPTATGEGGEGGFPGVAEGAACIIKNHVFIQDGFINGDVHLFSEIQGSFQFGQSDGPRVYGDVYTRYSGEPIEDVFILESWQKELDFYKYVYYIDQPIIWNNFGSVLENIEYPSHYSPSHPKIEEIKFDNKKYEAQIYEDVYVEKIAAGDQYLTIDNRGRDISIFVDHFEALGWRDVVMLGDGKVDIYVSSKFSLTSSRINQGGDLSNLRIFYFGDTSPDVSGGGAELNGSLLIKKSAFTLGGSAKITGPIISGGSYVEIAGGVTSSGDIFLPNGKVVVSGSAHVNGIVIAESLYVSGGDTKIDFKPFDSSLLFPDSGNGGGESFTPTIDDLISAGPAIEP